MNDHTAWRVSFDMWPLEEGRPRHVERVTHDEADALDQYKGLLSMVAPHEPRPCGEHIWNPKIERKASDVRRYVVYVCPGCGWMDGRTSWCCAQPQCRVPDETSPTGTLARPCDPVEFVAEPDLPAGAVPEAAWETVAVALSRAEKP